MLTLKLPPGNLVAPEDRGDYPFGDNAPLFLRVDWTLKQTMSFFQRLNEPYSALYLPYLVSKPWDALEKLLPDGTKEVRAMHEKCQYKDYYTERFSSALLPLMVLTVDPDQYVDETRGLGAEDLARATMDEAECSERLEQYHQLVPAGSELNPGRVAQVLMGSGYSLTCMPLDGTSVLRWQFSELTNGDVLLLAGYEWHNK